MWRDVISQIFEWNTLYLFFLMHLKEILVYSDDTGCPKLNIACFNQIVLSMTNIEISQKLWDIWHFIKNDFLRKKCQRIDLHRKNITILVERCLTIDMCTFFALRGQSYSTASGFSHWETIHKHIHELHNRGKNNTKNWRHRQIRAVRTIPSS